MSYKFKTLSNGLKVFLIPYESIETITVLLAFKTGSRIENKTEWGLSHTVEHMVYRGAKRRKNSREVVEFIDSIGGEHNAFTGKEETAYYVKVTSDNFEKGVDFISDNVINASFPEDELKKEKSIILEEMKMYEDMPQRKTLENFENISFSSDSLGHEIIGTPQNVKSFNSQILHAYKNNYYTADNAVLVLAGNYKKVPNYFSIVEKYFANMPKGKINIYQKSHNSDNIIKIVKKDTEQSNLVMGFWAPSMQKNERYTARVLSTIMGGSMSSRLFSEIREKRGLAYHIRCAYNSFSDNGLIYTYAGVSNHKYLEALKEILNQYKIAAKEGFSSKEIEIAKEIIKSNILIASEDPSVMAVELVGEMLLAGRNISISEIVNQYLAVSETQLMQLAKKVFEQKQVIFSAIGKDLNEKKINLLLKQY